MRNKLLGKCLLSIGMLLFLIMLMPATKAKALATIEPGKNEDYRLNLKSVTLVKGTSYTLKVYNLGENAKVSFKSDNQEIASVSEDGGVITAKAVGNTIITATIKDGNITTPLTCEVLVGPPAFSVKITKSRIILGAGNTDFLNVILKPSNTAESAKFSSYDSAIASVSPSGRITAKKIGLTYLFAVIAALNDDNRCKYDTCTVIVVPSEEVPAVEAYFTDNASVLDTIPKEDLNKAVYEFLNKYDAAQTTSLVNSLNRYLDDKFNLKAKKDEQAKLQTNLSEVISGNTANY